MSLPEKAIKLIGGNALSDKDLKDVLGNNIKIWRYPDLQYLESADELFDDEGRAIILYPTVADRVGHWVALLNFPRKIEFFDPYGESPKKVKDNVSEQKQKQLDIDKPYLLNLLRTANKPIYYNTYKFQKKDKDVFTCGRHCAVRLLYSPYSLEKYTNIIKRTKMSPDDFVSAVIFNKLKK